MWSSLGFGYDLGGPGGWNVTGGVQGDSLELEWYSQAAGDIFNFCLDDHLEAAAASWCARGDGLSGPPWLLDDDVRVQGDWRDHLGEQRYLLVVVHSAVALEKVATCDLAALVRSCVECDWARRLGETLRYLGLELVPGKVTEPTWMVWGSTQ